MITAKHKLNNNFLFPSILRLNSLMQTFSLPMTADAHAACHPASSTRLGSILFVVSHSSSGGVQEIWANLAEGFQTRGHDVSLVALYPHRPPARETSSLLPWRYVAEKRPVTVQAQIRLLRDIVRLFATQSPEYVFTAMPAANVLVPIAAKLARSDARIVISHHTPVATYNPALNAIDGLVGCLRNVGRVVSVSQAVQSSLEGKPRTYLCKRRIISNALPPRIETRLSHLAAYRRGRPRGRRVVATGRLAAQKNYPVLVRAAELMTDVDVQIVGAGPDEAALKALAASLGVTDRVSFLGHCSREEALARLADGDVFVQPSLFEGHSLALIEAASLGLPVVVSDVPVQIEGITAADGSRCGIAVGVHDHVGLAREILRLLDDPAVTDTWAARAMHLAQANRYDRMIDSYLEELA